MLWEPVQGELTRRGGGARGGSQELEELAAGSGVRGGSELAGAQRQGEGVPSQG